MKYGIYQSGNLCAGSKPPHRRDQFHAHNLFRTKAEALQVCRNRNRRFNSDWTVAKIQSPEQQRAKLSLLAIHLGIKLPAHTHGYIEVLTSHKLTPDHPWLFVLDKLAPGTRAKVKRILS